VLDELGLQLNDQLSGLPQASGSLSIAGSKQPVAAAAGANDDGGNLADADADLQARLENLRRE
jgi:charged multivesicular body protein 2A